MSAKVKMLKDVCRIPTFLSLLVNPIEGDPTSNFVWNKNQITIAIGDEIRESSALAEKMNDTFDSTRVRLRGTMNRMLVMAEKTGVGWRVWLGFFCAVFLLFTYVWLFWILNQKKIKKKERTNKQTSKQTRNPENQANLRLGRAWIKPNTKLGSRRWRIWEKEKSHDVDKLCLKGKWVKLESPLSAWPRLLHPRFFYKRTNLRPDEISYPPPPDTATRYLDIQSTFFWRHCYIYNTLWWTFHLPDIRRCTSTTIAYTESFFPNISLQPFLVTRARKWREKKKIWMWIWIWRFPSTQTKPGYFFFSNEHQGATGAAKGLWNGGFFFFLHLHFAIPPFYFPLLFLIINYLSTRLHPRH